MMSKTTPAPIRSSVIRRPARVWAAALALAAQAAPAWVSAQDAAAPQHAGDDTSPAAPEPPAAALEHYERGRTHYLAGRYREALQELEQAMRLDASSPNLVYNVARVYELLGEIDHAIAFYKRYRDMLPQSELAERQRTEQTLQRLAGARDQVEADPQPPPPPPPTEHGVADGAFWSVLSAGVVTLAGAGVTGWYALENEEKSETFRLGEDGSLKRREIYADRANHLALASDAMLLVGATFVVTAVLLYAVRERPVEPSKIEKLDVKLSSHGATLTWTGRL